jgi:dihydroorotate dehydrogenase (NAD+) catalytic subunit
VLTASGTCGYGPELDDFIDVSRLGGILVKGTTLEPREGNKYPRMAETPSGMLNAVGLQNKGIDYFEKNIYPRISGYDTNIIVNINGSYLEDYVKLAKRVDKLEKIPAIELNISCPNVKMGGMAFGTRLESAREVTRAVRNAYSKKLIVKLSPNVTNIVEFALVAEEEGADSVSLINTLLGMAVDIRGMKPSLSTITGGLSGPAIKPVALRMVWQVANAVKIPVIGMGGIMTASDAIEFILAGATAVQIGTASFIDPQASVKILEGIESYMIEKKFSDLSEIVGYINKK